MMITKVGILGAGTMGTQLSLLFASHGFSVIVWNHQIRNDFAKIIQKEALKQVKLGSIVRENIDDVTGRIVCVTNMSELSCCDLIVEAVKEDFAVKAQVFKSLRYFCSSVKMVSTNTSTLSITELASLTAAPSMFLGIHFFNPPTSMKLVELVKGEFTTNETVSYAINFLNILGKHPVVLPETPGFVVNRLLFPMINEAIFLLGEGISDAKTIDSCMKLGAHHPMGPLELADFIGLDVCLSILDTLVTETGDGKYRPAPLLRKYVRAGKFGRKSGSGFYSYRRGQ